MPLKIRDIVSCHNDWLVVPDLSSCHKQPENWTKYTYSITTNIRTICSHKIKENKMNESQNHLGFLPIGTFCSYEERKHFLFQEEKYLDLKSLRWGDRNQVIIESKKVAKMYEAEYQSKGCTSPQKNVPDTADKSPRKFGLLQSVAHCSLHNTVAQNNTLEKERSTRKLKPLCFQSSHRVQDIWASSSQSGNSSLNTQST